MLNGEITSINNAFVSFYKDLYKSESALFTEDQTRFLNDLQFPLISEEDLEKLFRPYI